MENSKVFVNDFYGDEVTSPMHKAGYECPWKGAQSGKSLGISVHGNVKPAA